MREEIELTEADWRYEEAYAAHYEILDLRLALILYRGVIDVFPNTLQAESARLQLLKIVDAVVPITEILDTLQTLATTHLESKAQNSPSEDPVQQHGLRHQQDREWEISQRASRHAEIQRRVKEHRRGPFI